MSGLIDLTEKTESAFLMNAAIIGGGKGCKSILQMVENGALGRFRMRVLGVADVDSKAVGIRYARKIGIPFVTADYRKLYDIPGLDVIIELTGDVTLRDLIEHTRPRHVRLIDHYGARLFWEVHQAETAFRTQRVAMQKKEKAERERIAQILDGIPDEILVVDSNMMVQDANQSFLRNNNCSIEDVRNRYCYEVEQGVRRECQAAIDNCPFSTVMESGKPTSLVRKHFTPDGEPHYVSIVGAPLHDKEGGLIGMIEITRDISGRIRLEEALAATEVHLQQFMEKSPLGTYVKNRAGQYIDVNPAACALLGRSDQEILGRTDQEIFPSEIAEKLQSGEQEVWRMRDAISIETEMDIGGRRIFFSTVKFPILNKEGEPTGLCGLSQDITAQKEAEDELRETREYLQNIMDNAPAIIITTDLNGDIVSFNRGAELSLGYSAGEVIGKHVTLFSQDPSLLKEFLRMINSGRAVQDYSFELLCKGNTLLPVSLTLSQLLDSSGKMIGTVCISKDISHRNVLMKQILQSERMAAVGRLASGVAHEINNPLAIIAEIAGYLNELAEDEVEGVKSDLLKELKEGLPKISQHVQRGRDITHRLLSFARKTEKKIEQADVNSALIEILP
ncbi:MAG: PAS domain-containing protein, partial [Thermodesulfobacteriota bacterium]|nr:PAS domain-containing protein [Thermodesulfobacteriota bacterium]